MYISGEATWENSSFIAVLLVSFTLSFVVTFSLTFFLYSKYCKCCRNKESEPGNSQISTVNAPRPTAEVECFHRCPNQGAIFQSFAVMDQHYDDLGLYSSRGNGSPTSGASRGREERIWLSDLNPTFLSESDLNRLDGCSPARDESRLRAFQEYLFQASTARDVDTATRAERSERIEPESEPTERRFQDQLMQFSISLDSSLDDLSDLRIALESQDLSQHDSPSASASEDRDEFTFDDDIYDPDFEDPRLFCYLDDALESSLDTVEEPRTREDVIEKHMWPCVVCLAKPPETLFTPCYHAACCLGCADQIMNSGSCPVCSFAVDQVDKVYFTQNTCVVCMDKPPQVVFKPCFHAVCCKDCSDTIVSGDTSADIESKCPICKAYIVEGDTFRVAYT